MTTVNTNIHKNTNKPFFFLKHSISISFILSGDKILFAFCLILFENFLAKFLSFKIFKIELAKRNIIASFN